MRFEAVPLAVEGKILTASEAAECAADQNRYWDYHDVLFANFDQISLDAYDTSRLKEYAVKLGLDTEAFNSCLDSHKYKQAVIDKTKEVVQAGYPEHAHVLHRSHQRHEYGWPWLHRPEGHRRRPAF